MWAEILILAAGMTMIVLLACCYVAGEADDRTERAMRFGEDKQEESAAGQ